MSDPDIPIRLTPLEWNVRENTYRPPKLSRSISNLKVARSRSRSPSLTRIPRSSSLLTMNLNSNSKPSSATSTISQLPSPRRPQTAAPFTYIGTLQKKSLQDIRKCMAREKSLNDVTLINALKANYRFIYRINDGAPTTNTILQEVCEERGWKEFKEASLFKGTPYERAMRGATGWNLWWSYSIYQFSPYKYLRHWQFTNHNPKGFQFCNKLYLTMYLRKMKAIHGPIYDFYPLSFVIPEDFHRLYLEHNRRASESFTMFNFCNLLSCSPENGKPPPSPIPNSLGPPGFIRPRVPTPRSRPATPVASYPTPSEIRFHPVWISKPVSQSQGKGIYVTTDLNGIAASKKNVVQEYICRPLLIGGYKWDVRIYVCVSAIDPLVIYVYHEGLCRFCTEKYDVRDLTQTYSHLTNASINKLSPEYDKDKEFIGHGCKWSLRRLRQYFREKHINDWLMWQKLMTLVVLTVVGDSLRLGYSASNRNCFDLFGFDVLVDEDMKPWLLECNYSPGLGGDCETDRIVKRPMLHELFNLLGFPDKAQYENAEREQKARPPSRGQGAGEPDYLEFGIYDRDDLTKQYFDMVLSRLQNRMDANEQEKQNDGNWRWKYQNKYSSEERLHDAKSIYSQNLVVQYLKNQSGVGKIPKPLRDQLITVAAKKLRSKMAQIGGSLGGPNGALTTNIKKTKKSKATSTRSDGKLCRKTSSSSFLSSKKKEEKTIVIKCESKTKTNAKQVKKERSLVLNTEKPQQPTKTPAKKEAFRIPDSETFQKLKYYFDAGVDYPMDLKTGKFKEFPALISVRKDWFNPTKQEGGWIRVYPFDARTTKSPYKSSLTDVRQAVRSVENYLKTAEHIFNTNPNENDEFYKKKIKTVCRRDTEIWIPPLGRPSSALSTEDNKNNNYMDEIVEWHNKDRYATPFTDTE